MFSKVHEANFEAARERKTEESAEKVAFQMAAFKLYKQQKIMEGKKERKTREKKKIGP